MAQPGISAKQVGTKAESNEERLNRSFAKAFRAEIQGWVGPRREAKGRPPVELESPSASNGLMGVAFSGGGMRSATFSLGVAQALARAGLLDEADYLATVSGGGYFGTSVSSLCAEDLSYSAPPITRFGVSRENFPYGFPGAQHSLEGKSEEGGTPAPVHGLESPALRHVRENANFLTRSLGLFDADMWSALAYYLYGLLGTWLLFLMPFPTLVFLATMFIPETAWSRFSPMAPATWLGANPWALALPLLLVGSVLFLGWTRMVVAREQQVSLTDAEVDAMERVRRALGWLQRLLVGLALIGLLLVLLVLGVWGIHKLLSIQGPTTDYFGEAILGALGLGGLGVAGASARKLSLPGYAGKLLPKLGLIVGGYVLLLVLALGWYYFLWTWAFPSTASHRGDYTLVRGIAVMSGTFLLFSAFWGAGSLNRLSLNFVYEQRILRVWTIAARRQKEQPTGRWTRVWHRADLTMGSLKQPVPASPLHLVVAAVNIQGSTGAATLDRKSDSFVISPITCGSSVTGWDTADNQPHFNRMRLSMAASISGAAVSPNMGMATQPTLSVVTTLLNIRLGAWAANPGRRKLVGVITEYFPGLYWKEMLGRASHLGRYVYLSDGGHFENLGVYELLRRRCKYIIAVDATGEPLKGQPLNYGGIGVPLRLARTDFGVEVVLDMEPLERDEKSGYVKSYFAVGKIRYPRLDVQRRHGSLSAEDADTGYFVLIKAGLVEGKLTPDILNYLRQENPRFPYDSTMDQQFAQPQFESYRQLGYVAGRALVDVAGRGGEMGDTLAHRFEGMYEAYRAAPKST